MELNKTMVTVLDTMIIVIKKHHYLRSFSLRKGIANIKEQIHRSKQQIPL